MTENKLLVAGDTHGSIEHWRYLIKTAAQRGCDRIFQVGDFGYWEHMDDGREFLNRLDRVAGMYKIQIYFLDGNHDKTSLIVRLYGDRRDEQGFLMVRPHIRYAPRGHRWTWEQVSFIALGGAYSVDKKERLDWETHGSGRAERYWFPEEEMSDADMAAILTDPRPVDVILAHDKPRSSNPAWSRKDFPECYPNQDRMQQALRTLRPAAFIHGHLHYAYTDTVRCSDEDATQVIGLDCDREAAHRGRFYNPEDSWMILHLDKEVSRP